MNDYHTARHVFGEMTFGEYWNLAGCHAECCEIRDGNWRQRTVNFGVEGNVFFMAFDQSVREVALSSKIKVSGHRVTTLDLAKYEITIGFYRTEPLESPV